MNYCRVNRSAYLYDNYNMYDYPEKSSEYIYCEDCDTAVPLSDAAPDGLCFECYTDRLIDSIYDRNLRDYILRNRCDFMSFLRETDYDC